MLGDRARRRTHSGKGGNYPRSARVRGGRRSVRRCRLRDLLPLSHGRSAGLNSGDSDRGRAFRAAHVDRKKHEHGGADEHPSQRSAA